MFINLNHNQRFQRSKLIFNRALYEHKKHYFMCRHMHIHYKVRIFFYSKNNVTSRNKHTFLSYCMKKCIECNTCFPHFSYDPTVLVVYICYISKKSNAHRCVHIVENFNRPLPDNSSDIQYIKTLN